MKRNNHSGLIDLFQCSNKIKLTTPVEAENAIMQMEQPGSQGLRPRLNGGVTLNHCQKALMESRGMEMRNLSIIFL